MFGSALANWSFARAMPGVVLAVVAVAAGAAAEPSVPYVPTPQEVVERMLEIAKVGSGDYLIDLGSGDGRIVITAAKKFGARGFGVDLNPVRIAESNENAKKAGVTDRVSFVQRNLFDADLSDATVITMYLLPRVNLELRPKLLSLKPGTRLVSHDFSMDDWKPDESVDMNVKAKYGNEPGTSSIYFWIVPAKVAGPWQWQLSIGGKPVPYELALEQKYQTISGGVRVGSRGAKLNNARLRGDLISLSFTAEVNGEPLAHELTGRVTGDTITGTVRVSGKRVQGEYDWNAARVAKTSQSGASYLNLAGAH